jgi:adenine/guanine phosphoribosyltransferase-like PRPP-binding protein
MTNKETNAETLALSALGWTLQDDGRASRFLALTGLTPETLRARVGDPDFLAAAVHFLEGYEPDLVACAEALGIAPASLVAARRELEQ